jgi:hypothetical protein
LVAVWFSFSSGFSSRVLGVRGVFESAAAMGILSLITGKAGPSGFGSSSTAEQVTDGVDASRLTVVITGNPLISWYSRFLEQDSSFTMVVNQC